MKMLAAYFKNHGDLSNLEYGYVDMPKLKTGEVLVKVKACALNHLDLWTLQGIPSVKIPMPHIPGCDMAGEVVERGPGAKDAPLGKSVVVAPGISCGRCVYCKDGWDSLCPDYKILGFQVNGGCAQYAAVPAKNIIPVSKIWTLEEWSGVPLVFLTAWHMLWTHARVQKKDVVLIQAAGSGVGSAAIQIAKYLGATVITTAGTPQKCQKARAYGADHVINYREKDFVEEVLRITKNRGADVAIDHIGGETLVKTIQALTRKGRLVTCGSTSGPAVTLNLRYIFSKQLQIQGSYMGSQRELLKVIRRVERKRFRPVTDKIYPLREMRQALERMIRRENFGKIILTPPDK